MRERLGAQELSAACGEVEGLSGRLLAPGAPSTGQRGSHLVVDVPLALERGPMEGRVAFDAEGRASGLFVLYPDVP
jgi:hypothetical protein